MGRKIEIEFKDKTYTIEYNRLSVIKLMEKLNKGGSEFETAIDFVYYGLLKNHSNEMPERETVASWLLVMDNMQEFVNVLQESIQEVLTSIEQDKKSGNLKWGIKA